MTAAYLAAAVLPTLIALAWGCYWKSRFHRAKSEVYQEFADTYNGMLTGHMFSSKKEERRAESKRHHMRLALCDPLVRDGLADALEAAERDWNRASFDPPRDWEIVRRTSTEAAA